MIPKYWAPKHVARTNLEVVRTITSTISATGVLILLADRWL